MSCSTHHSTARTAHTTNLNTFCCTSARLQCLQLQCTSTHQHARTAHNLQHRQCYPLAILHEPGIQEQARMKPLTQTHPHSAGRPPTGTAAADKVPAGNSNHIATTRNSCWKSSTSSRKDACRAQVRHCCYCFLFLYCCCSFACCSAAMLLWIKLGAMYVKPSKAPAALGSVGVPQGLSTGRCSVQILSKFSTLCGQQHKEA